MYIHWVWADSCVTYVTYVHTSGLGVSGSPADLRAEEERQFLLLLGVAKGLLGGRIQLRCHACISLLHCLPVSWLERICVVSLS